MTLRAWLNPMKLHKEDNMRSLCAKLFKKYAMKFSEDVNALLYKRKEDKTTIKDEDGNPMFEVYLNIPQ